MGIEQTAKESSRKNSTKLTVNAIADIKKQYTRKEFMFASWNRVLKGCEVSGQDKNLQILH